MVPSDHNLLRALRGAWTEHIPFLPYTGTWPARLLDVPADRYLQDPVVLANGVVRFAVTFGADGVPLMTDPQMEAISLGCKAHWSAIGPPSVASHPLGQVPAVQLAARPDDYLPAIPSAVTGRWPVVIEAGRRVREELEAGAAGRPVALAGVVSGPCTIAGHLRGLALFSDLANEPAAADALFQFAGRVTAAATSMYVHDIGCDVVAINDTPASMLRPEFFRTHVVPNLQPALRVIHDAGRVSSFWA